MVSLWANGFHSFSNKTMSILDSVDVNKIVPSEEHKKLLLKNITKIKSYIATGNKTDAGRQAEEPTTAGVVILSYNNITTVLQKRRKNEKYSIDPYVMRALLGSKIFEGENMEENLLKANKVALKAKSVFIHLSTVEDGELFYIDRFIKRHPFNEFIPEIVQFLTQKHPSVGYFQFNLFRFSIQFRLRLSIVISVLH